MARLKKEGGARAGKGDASLKMSCGEMIFIGCLKKG